MRLGLILHIIIWLVLVLAIQGRWNDVSGRAAGFGTILLLVGVLAVATVAVQSIGAERTRQTLDILLTTPVTAREIVLQKSAAARRLGWIFSFNLVFITVGKIWLGGNFSGESWLRVRGFDAILLGRGYEWFHLACVLVGLPLLFAVVRWFSIWISIRFPNRQRAFQICLALLTLWCSAPLIGRFLMPDNDAVRMWSAAVSPQGLLYINDMAAFQVLTDVGESGDMTTLRKDLGLSYGSESSKPRLAPSSPFIGALVVVSIQYCFVALFRFLSLNGAEKLLRRAD